ncbi:hypothetical protein LTR39_000744, partial [Cryomyces antarcticus]
MGNCVAVPVRGSAHVDEWSKERSKEQSKEQSNASSNEERKIATPEAVQSEDTATAEDEAAHRQLDGLRESQERQRKHQERFAEDIPHTIRLEYQEADGSVIYLEALTDQEATENVISVGLVERLQLTDKTWDEFDEDMEALGAAGREVSPRTWVRLHYKVRSDGDCFVQSFRVHYGASENDLVLGIPALLSMHWLSQIHPQVFLHATKPSILLGSGKK